MRYHRHRETYASDDHTMHSDGGKGVVPWNHGSEHSHARQGHCCLAHVRLDAQSARRELSSYAGGEDAVSLTPVNCFEESGFGSAES